eukprot:TRINITY_DN16132_c0_g1_i1.p1 TRINITY_DN16132_c0_g1~~TRINITY_DN16132_c0_g1_i1.p1  ORF type:complete len:596 (+),score=170.05 TRINITY_DN16132_c0_g1_i1:41-1789(+)
MSDDSQEDAESVVDEKPFEWEKDKRTVGFDVFEGTDKDDPSLAGSGSNYARRHTAVTFTSDDVVNQPSPTHDHQGRRLSDGPLSSFEKSARKDQYFDDTTPVKDIKNPLPRCVDLLPRIKELNKEISTLKRSELELVSSKNEIALQRDMYEAALNGYRQSSLHSLEREERAIREVLVWAWQEMFSSLRYTAVCTEPDAVFISTPFQSSGDLRRALARERSHSPSSPVVTLRAHRGSWEWEMVDEQEQVPAAQALQQREQLAAKLATSCTRISQLEVSLLAKEGIIVNKNQELERADQQISDLTAQLAELKQKTENRKKEPGRDERVPGLYTRPATQAYKDDNFAENNKFRPYSSINAEALAHPPFTKLNSTTGTALTSPRETPRSRSAPNDRERSSSVKRKRNIVSTALVDVSCSYAPHLSGTYSQLEKEKNINNHPVWTLVSGQTDILLHTSSKGHYVFSENNTIIARSKKPHRNAPITSTALSWVVLTNLGEWAGKKIVITGKKKPSGSGPGAPRQSTASFLKNLMSSKTLQKQHSNTSSQHVSVPVRRRPQSVTRSASEEKRHLKHAAEANEALDRHLL